MFNNKKKKQIELNIFNNSKEEHLLPSIKELTKAAFKSTCDFKSSALSVWNEINETLN